MSKTFTPLALLPQACWLCPSPLASPPAISPTSQWKLHPWRPCWVLSPLLCYEEGHLQTGRNGHCNCSLGSRWGISRWDSLPHSQAFLCLLVTRRRHKHTSSQGRVSCIRLLTSQTSLKYFCYSVCVFLNTIIINM